MRKNYRQRALAAEEAAEQELAGVPDYIWDGRSLPVPVEAIADSHYRLLVREEAQLAGLAGWPEGHVSGLLVPVKREIWVDGVEAHQAPARRRFTIGHEVGHWVLHCEQGVAAHPTAPPYCRTDSVQEVDVGEEAERPRQAFTPYPMPEHEANHFGAALLMPRAVVLEEHDWCKGDIAEMARHFGVSQRAMELRVRFIGPMSHN